MATITTGSIVGKAAMDADSVYEYTTVGGETWSVYWNSNTHVDIEMDMSPTWTRKIQSFGGRLEFTQLTPPGKVLRFRVQAKGPDAEFHFYVQ